MGPRLLHYSDLESAFDDPERIGRLAGTIDALRDDETLVVGTGDNTAPGVLALFTEGEQALDFFAAVEPDADTFGNHDFDFGFERTREIVARSPQTWVGTNVFLDGERFGTEAGVVPSLLLTAGDHRVGLFGVTDPETPSINPVASDLSFGDPIATARETVADLRARGADYVVALSHLGQGDDDLAAAVDVDAVLGGHVHSERVERVAGTLCTRPNAGGHVLLEIELGPDGPSATRHAVADGPLDESVAETLRDRMTAQGLDEVVATVSEPVERPRTAINSGECRIGNFVADAYRWAAGADVGLQNSGGLREGPPLSGDVTVADLVSLAPFRADVVVAEVSGAKLRSVFREGAPETLGFSEAGTWHAHVSGASMVYDAGTGEVREVRVGGEPLDPGGTYILATTEYLVATDSEFPTLDRPQVVERLDVQYEVLADYAREMGVEPTLEDRIVFDGTLAVDS
jgi:2',3'-cyclic-nucleotide 2'-phosphodiesterase (5'-nucleotidase family)